METGAAPQVHSIGIIRDHAIVCAGPLFWDVAKLLTGADARDAWTWDDDANATIYAVPLKPGRPVETYAAPPFFAFHHVNAWNEDGEIVFDVLVNENITSKDADPAAVFARDVLADPSRRDVLGAGHLGRLTRYSLPRGGGTARVTQLDAPGAELPAVSDAVVGQPRAAARYLGGRRIRVVVAAQHVSN